jgi:hypothetical protein
MPGHRVPRRSRPFPATALAASIAIAFQCPSAAVSAPQSPQTFHLNEIVQIMAGFNGNTNIQAVELKMLQAGQQFISGTSIDVYDANGNFVATLGTFNSDVPNGTGQEHILCATQQFKTQFGIQPDLIISPGIPTPNGQVVFNNTPLDCPISTVPYGAINTLLFSASAAPPLPAAGATALVRAIDTPYPPSCPLAEDAAQRFQLLSGSSASHLVFQNNGGATAQVFTTVASAEGAPTAPALRVSPNPFTATTTIEAPDWSPLLIHDVAGRLVRVLTCGPGGACPQVSGRFRGTWDGIDRHGRRVPSGVYFIRYVGRTGPVERRVVYLR